VLFEDTLQSGAENAGIRVYAEALGLLRRYLEVDRARRVLLADTARQLFEWNAYFFVASQMFRRTPQIGPQADTPASLLGDVRKRDPV